MRARPDLGSRLSVILAVLILVLGVQLPGLTAAPKTLAAVGAFDDDDGRVHEWAIDALAAAGIADGCNVDNTMFCPSVPIDRATMAIWLVRSLGEEGNLHGHVGYFTDVAATDAHAPYVERLFELGVTLGTGDVDGTGNRYNPFGAVSRAQMAAYLVRAFSGGEPSEQGAGIFADVPMTAWYRGVVELLFDMEITAGCGTNPRTYCPAMSVPRDQMATFVARGLGLSPDTTVVTTITDVWDPPDCPGGGFCITPAISEGFGKRDISWCIADFSVRLIDENALVAEAFAAFAAITVGETPMFTFSSTTCDLADIEFNWQYSLGGANGDAVPDSYFTPTHVVIRVRDDGTMTPRIELSTLIHEIGHALGLAHSLDPDCIMYPDSGGAAMQTGAFCQEELNTLGNLYTGYVGASEDAFHAGRVSATGEFGPVEVVATFTNSGTMPLPCAVDEYWTSDADLGWQCRWFDDGVNWGWEVERFDGTFEGPARGVGLYAVAIATSAYDVTWEGVESVVGAGSVRSFGTNTTDRGLVIPFVTTYFPAGDDDFGWQLFLTKTPLSPGPGQFWNWQITTIDGSEDSRLDVTFVRIEPKDDWSWSYGFTQVVGADSELARTTNVVSAFDWTETVAFAVTTGYQTANVPNWIWATNLNSTSVGCPGGAAGCVETTLSGFAAPSTNLAEVMTVVLGR